MDKSSPIGVFDSGLGGISVLTELHKRLPHEDLIFMGDSKHNPYGTKTKAEITERCLKICDFFMEKGCKAIVIACNTATSASAPILREKYPIDIIGMEPALKVAAERRKTNKIAVWATQLTLSEKKFSNLLHRFDDDHEIIKVPCPRLVELVENDQLENTELVDEVLKEYLALSGPDVDAIVLGCTHFVFFKARLQQLAPDIEFIDGNDGTVRRLESLLAAKNLLNETGGAIDWHNTRFDKVEQSKRLFERMEYLNEQRLAEL